MIIKRIEVINMYGYLNKNIHLNKDINLIVGINGSGNTTLLNLILKLLNHDDRALSEYEFDSIKLYFDYVK